MIKKKIRHDTKLYRVRSRWLFFGWVLAHSESDAIEVAIDTGLHKRGSTIKVWECQDYKNELEPMTENQLRGRLYWPGTFNRHLVLIKANE